MSFFAIRDDDVSYFTNWQDIDSLYSSLWGKIPVSFAIIPFAMTPRGNKLRDDGIRINNKNPMPIHKNLQLVDYLKSKKKCNEIEIMLHGYSHEYSYNGNRRKGEYIWKAKEILIKETFEGKHYLENLFDCSIRVFVPPSNMISKAGSIAIETSGLHLSGIIGRMMDRPFSANYLKAYISRWAYRAFKGRPYPFPLYVGKHVELVAYSLTPTASLEWLRETLRLCYMNEAPFVLAVHHWELLSSPTLRDLFIQLVEEALMTGYTPATVSQCMRI